MTFSFGSNRLQQKRRQGDETYSIRSEEELAKELASRRISPFTAVKNSHDSYSFILLYVAAFCLFIHLDAFFDIYAVQLSRITGNYAETEATVVYISSRKVKHTCISDARNCKDSESTVYSVDAVADDGTRFHFSGTVNYYGSRIRVKYSKSNPGFAYVDAGLLDMFFDKYPGLVMGAVFVFFAFLAFAGTYAVFRWNRKCNKVVARGLYLPVLETYSYEEKTGRDEGRRYAHNEYAPVYRYAMPDGKELRFRGLWTRNKPKGALSNHHAEFRVYMTDPEDPDNNEYFIKEIPRKVRADPGV